MQSIQCVSAQPAGYLPLPSGSGFRHQAHLHRPIFQSNPTGGLGGFEQIVFYLRIFPSLLAGFFQNANRFLYIAIICQIDLDNRPRPADGMVGNRANVPIGDGVQPTLQVA